MSDLPEALLVEKMRRMAKRLGSQQLLAEKLGFSEGFISDVFNARRGISEPLAAKLGYQRIVMFRKNADAIHFTRKKHP